MNTRIFNKYKSFAFTLAEVLITLGIIGIVAVLTVPNLIAKWQSKSYTISRDVFNAKFREASTQMNSAGVLSGYSSTEDFVNSFKRYMKMLKICDNTSIESCFSKEIKSDDGSAKIDVNTLKTSEDFGRKDYNSNTEGIVLSNGYTIVLSYNPNCPFIAPTVNDASTTSCISMVYDINGKKGPNQVGKDIATLNADIGFCIKVGNICISTGDSTISPINTCDGSPDYEYDTDGSRNGHCATNYWAAAKKICKAQGMNLPTMRQWADIASEHYGAQIKGESVEFYSGLTIKNDLGFRDEYWTDQRGGNEEAYSIGFYETTTGFSYEYSKSASKLKVRCVK